ncbi:putative peptidoglycan biosynthesis protein MviN [mine drainage metagenome]|uniref:Putative peptidoglycan biosynthesis protein MviN n=1 Tax=mine drainage metagenome TaxID=410659 RepID=A0A1J5PWK3_9ZZZZ
MLPPVGSPPPPEAAIFASPRPSFDALVADDAPLVVRRFDPTRLVLAIVTIAVLIGIFIALKGLFSPITTSGAGALPVPGSTTSSASPSASPTTSRPGASPTTAAPSGGAPVIASVASVNPPPGTGPEHPDTVGLAIDGNPATFWTTSTYAQANMGGKPGVGFALTLAKKTTVTAVTLHINGSGGNVEVRATDAANPTTGPVLASGPMGADTVLTFSKPVETQTIMLWFTLMPQTADGSNRVELNEVTVS